MRAERWLSCAKPPGMRMRAHIGGRSRSHWCVITYREFRKNAHAIRSIEFPPKTGRKCLSVNENRRHRSLRSNCGRKKNAHLRILRSWPVENSSMSWRKYKNLESLGKCGESAASSRQQVASATADTTGNRNRERIGDMHNMHENMHSMHVFMHSMHVFMHVMHVPQSPTGGGNQSVSDF